MDFDLGDRERTIREEIKGLFDPDSRAALAQLEGGDTQQNRDLILHWLKNFAQVGYLMPGLDSGKNNIPLVATQETLAAISPSLFLSVEVSTRIFGRLVSAYGRPKQKAEILPILKQGGLIGAVGLSERGMSIENNPLTTTGRPNGKGFLVSGSKAQVVNAPIADWIAVAGKISGEGKEGVGFFLIRKDAEGLLIGPQLVTLGYTGMIISPVSLESCRVPSELVIGPFVDEDPLKTVRMWEDQVLTASSLGLMERCYNTALDYAKVHESGGRPIIAYQEIGFKLAEMLTLLQTAQLLAYKAAWMAQEEDREAHVLVHCAKVFCTESAQEIASDALQILGAHGYLQGNPAEEGYRDAKYLQIAGTSSEISRIRIADALLY